MKFNERLKEIRKQKGLTQEQLVEKMGVSIAYLSKVETGKIHINLERLSQICEILNVSEGKILNGTSNSSELYLSSEFNALLRKCSPTQLKLAYKILRFYLRRRYLGANLKPIGTKDFWLFFLWIFKYIPKSPSPLALDFIENAQE